MQVRRFKREDLPAIQEWMEKRQMQQPRFSDLPTFGLVAHTDEGVLVAAGWIRRAEGRVGIFDSLVTNPDFSGPDRHEALGALVPAVIHLAKNLGVARLMAYTRQPAVIERAKNHGFEVQPHTLISLSL